MAAAVPPVKDGRRRYEAAMAETRKPTREERLAAALRANLRKRKAREAGAAGEPPSESRPEGDAGD